VERWRRRPGQCRLADASRPDDRDEAPLGQELGQPFDLIGTSDDSGRR
jgi:hypothetical protein